MFNIYKVYFLGLFFFLCYPNVVFSGFYDNDSINKTDRAGLKQGLWMYYDPSNTFVIEKGEYVDDKKNGVWYSFDSSGAKKCEVTYVMGEARGEAVFYYPDGKIREKGNWQMDHWVGNYKYYFPCGQLSYDWNYNESGKRNGEQNYYHENGNSMYTGVWVDGKTDGTLQVFNEDGVLIKEKYYAKGRIAEIKEIPQPEAQTQTQASDVPRLKFEGTGNYTITNDNGKTEAKGFFVKGLLFTGEKFNYDNKGNLISITYYLNGKKGDTKDLNI